LCRSRGRSSSTHCASEGRGESHALFVWARHVVRTAAVAQAGRHHHHAFVARPGNDGHGILHGGAILTVVDNLGGKPMSASLPQGAALGPAKRASSAATSRLAAHITQTQLVLAAKPG
jgi:hypothetical protein